MAIYENDALSDFVQRSAARRYVEASRNQPRSLERLVCCSDGEFRPPIAAEAFERDRVKTTKGEPYGR